MKIVGINGSPRKNGNCETLLNELVDSVNGTSKIYNLNELNLEYCQACQKCAEGDCVLNDDIPEVVDEILDSDLLVFTSPIYYGQITAQSKTLIDRFYQVSQNPNKSLKDIKVVQIYTQANPSDTFDKYIDYMNMMPFGYLEMELVDTVVARGLAGQGDSEELKKYIDEVKEIGSKLKE